MKTKKIVTWIFEKKVKTRRYEFLVSNYLDHEIYLNLI